MRRAAWLIAVVSILGLGQEQRSAIAGDGHHRGRRVDVDFDSLKAELYRAEGEWLVDVRYEVEIEDYESSDRFELIFYITEAKIPLLDAEGLRIEYVIPLDRPTDVDDDELEFESEVTLAVPERAFRDARRLKLHAIVVFANQSTPLAHKDRSVKFKRARRRLHDRAHADLWSRWDLRVDVCW